MYTIDLSQHKQREDVAAKVSRNMGVTARNFRTPVFQGPSVTFPETLNFRQDPSLFRDQVERAFQMVGRGVVKLEKDVPTAAGAGNVMKPWPDSRTPLRFDIIHNMLPPTMAVTAAITSGQDAQVYNLNGGMAWVQAHNLTLTDALRLLMSETARNGISGQHAQHALNNIRLRDGESWLTGLNRLVQLARAASLLPDRPYLSEEP